MGTGVAAADTTAVGCGAKLDANLPLNMYATAARIKMSIKAR